MIEDINKVQIKKIKRMCKLLSDKGVKEISFEFVMASLFPKVYENIKEELRKQYTLGYAAGLEESKNNLPS